jgi:putative transposase
MSRLRRWFVREKVFFITCNLLRTRTPLTDTDFEVLASAITAVRKRREFLITAYVFMPDHWHALIIPAAADILPRLMDAVKVAATRRINARRRTHGRLWQFRYYDHVIRTVSEYRDRIQYMHLNPVRKGLVRKPEDWTWSSIHSYGGPGPVHLPVDLLGLPADEKTPL